MPLSNRHEDPLNLKLINPLPLVLLILAAACVPTQEASQTSFLWKSKENYPLWFKDIKNPTATWGQEDPESRKIYFRIHLKKPRSKLPDFSNRLILNCLDYVVYTALKFKLLTREEAVQIYVRKSQGERLDKILFPSGIKKITYKIVDKKVIFDNLEIIESLDVILLDGPSHVVQAINLPKNLRKDFKFVSFSPRPIWGDGSSDTNQENISPELTTLESLIEEMIHLYPDVPSDWENIEILAGKPFWIRS